MNRRGFEQFGRELGEAGRRMQLGLPPKRRKRRSRHVVIAAALGVVLAVGVLMVIGDAGGGSNGSARAANLLTRARQLEAAAPACRIVNGTGQSVLFASRPLPAMVRGIGALQRSQSPEERDEATRLARRQLTNAPPSQILGDSLRVLSAPSGLSAIVVVLRDAPPTGQADPVGCLLRQRAALPRLATKASHEILVRAERLLTERVRAQTAELGDRHERLYVIFRDAHGQEVEQTSVIAARFEKAGIITELMSLSSTGTTRRILGVFPDGVDAIAVQEVNGRRRLTAPVAGRNVASVVVPRTFGRGLLVTPLGAENRQFGSSTLELTAEEPLLRGR